MGYRFGSRAATGSGRSPRIALTPRSSTRSPANASSDLLIARARTALRVVGLDVADPLAPEAQSALVDVHRRVAVGDQLGPDPVDVLTVFTGLPETPRRGWWDVQTGFAGSHASVPARNDEERRALEPSARRVELLGLRGNQHLDGPRSAADAEILADRVRAWAAAQGPAATVAAPACTGWRPGLVRRQLVRLGLAKQPGPRPSPGHEYVRDVVVSALAGRPVALLLYEELPYRWGGRADREAARVAAALDLEAELLMLPVDREAKAARIAVYASQLAHISPPEGRLDDPGVLPAKECYWRLGTTLRP